MDFIRKKYFNNKKVKILDTDPINYDYGLIIGNSSTKLVEYAYSGIEVFQLKSTKVNEMEGVGEIDFIKLNNNIRIVFFKPSLK